ncbi:hypothetical protein J6590_067512, partial [Homalodisca vitripennis]
MPTTVALPVFSEVEDKENTNGVTTNENIYEPLTDDRMARAKKTGVISTDKKPNCNEPFGNQCLHNERLVNSGQAISRGVNHAAVIVPKRPQSTPSAFHLKTRRATEQGTFRLIVRYVRHFDLSNALGAASGFNTRDDGLCDQQLSTVPRRFVLSP